MRWLDGITKIDAHEFAQALEVGDGQGSPACCSPWRRKGWATELNWVSVGPQHFLEIPLFPLANSLLFSTIIVTNFVYFLLPTIFLRYQKTIGNSFCFTQTKPNHTKRHQLGNPSTSCHQTYQPICVWTHSYLLSSIWWKRGSTFRPGLISPLMIWTPPFSTCIGYLTS